VSEGADHCVAFAPSRDGYVQEVEGGRENLTIRTLARIAEELDARPASLLRQPMSQEAGRGRPPKAVERPFREIEPAPADLYQTCVPLVTLEAAAGPLDLVRSIEVSAWVVPRTRSRITAGMFVARVVGSSMEPTIPRGAWALFRSPPRSDPRGRVVLLQRRDPDDPDDAGAYVVKKLEPVPRSSSRVRLRSADRSRPTPVVDLRDPSWRVVADLVEVLASK